MNGTIVNVATNGVTEIISVGVQGLQGAAQRDYSLQAATSIGGNRAVRINGLGKIEYANNSDSAAIFGVTTGAITDGQFGSVRAFGEMTEISWNWVAGNAVYLNGNGLLSQTPPSSGFITRIGYALTSTKIFIDIQTILRAI